MLATAADKSSTGSNWVTIDILPDDTLLEIFNSYLVEASYTEKWHTLVHVCSRWRRIVFASPRRLDLRILFTTKTEVKALHIWPILPIKVEVWDSRTMWGGADNIVAVLEHSNRICQLLLDNLPSSLLERIATAMQVLFPALTDLRLRASTMDKAVPVFPEGFLEGSAPRLRSCKLFGVPIPSIWKILLSANHLIDLHLTNIPHSGYISPEAMVAALSAAPNLKELELGFQSPRSRPDRGGSLPSPLTRITLPALTLFRFYGVCEYIECLVSLIDIPLLRHTDITFFNQLVFNAPLLRAFFARTEIFNAHKRATMIFDNHAVYLQLDPGSSGQVSYTLQMRIKCTKLDWQLSSMAQVCSSSLPPFSTLERLDILKYPILPQRQDDDVDNTQWLELLRPFSAIKDLHPINDLARLIAPALQELSTGGNVTEVLPTLQNLVIDIQPSGLIQEAVLQFVSARQLSSHPVAVHS